jgi:hypothetical protein
MKSYNKNNLQIVSKIILKNLTPDLIPKKWRKRNSIISMFGHCHTASVCLQKIFGTENIKLYRAKDEQDIWHWWCVDKNDQLIDLTAAQYYDWNRVPPYNQGEKASMLGWSYRKRVFELLEKVEKALDKLQ